MRLISVLFVLGSLMVQAQEKQIKRVPVSPTSPASGKEMFNTYCATCHGRAGTGDGPAASALKKTPADLTQLAKKNGGKFPAAKVTTVLESVDSPVHGSKEMPIWGELLPAVSGDREAEAHLRISNIVNYVGTLQQK